MKFYWLIILASICLSGCATLDKLDQNVKSTPGIIGDGTLVESSPIPDETPTVTPSATIDPGLSATGTVLSFQGQQLALTQTSQAIEGTASSATQTSAPQTSTTVAQIAGATETKQVWMTSVAPTAFIAMQNAQYGANVSDVVLYGGSILVLLIALGVFVITTSRMRAEEYRAYAEAQEAYSTANNPKKAGAVVDKVIVETRSQDGREVRWDTLPISLDAFAETVVKLRRLGRYTETPFTGKDNPLTKDNGQTQGTFTLFGKWMCEQGLAQETADGRYTLLDNAIKRMTIRVERATGKSIQEIEALADGLSPLPLRA